MPTSAQDRFEQLFTNKPRPTKPDIKQSTLSVDAPLQSQSHLSYVAKHTDERIALSKVHHVSSVADEKNTASSEDDEYSSLFEKKPEMKIKLLGRKVDSESYASEYSKVNRKELPTSIEYVPEGKISSNPLKDSGEVDVTDGDDVATYTGNGHPLIGRFCPFHLVAKFPYKYMKDPDDKVSRQFFANNRFYSRRWHLHYLHAPQSFCKGALLLVPISQVQKLVDEISSAFKVEVNVPPFPFTLDFYDDETPRPSFLATTTSRDAVNDKIELIPIIQEGYGECPPLASTALTKAYRVFHDKIERALLAVKGKSTSSNQRKVKKLFQILEESRNQLKRTQRYLGLRPRTKPIPTSSDLSWDEEKGYKEKQQRSCGLLIDFLDVDTSARYPFEDQPVFIAIDVESYERNHGFITEVGVSTLDSLDLVDLSPGPSGESWTKQIRSRHFRIRGREHLVNKDFCIGHPEAFQFGKSEFVTLDTVADVVDSCFEWPFSVQFKKEGHAPLSRDENDNKIAETDPAIAQKGSRARNLVIVGHDVGTDLEYLQNLGSEIFDPQLISSAERLTPKGDRYRILASILETLDTATIHKCFRMELQPRSLSHVCSDLGIEAWFVHNAGNDARYTLEALVKIAIQARLDEDEGQRKRDPESNGVVECEWEAQKMRHIDDRIESARRKVHRKVLAHDETTTTDTNTLSATDTDSIDWSLPIRSKKQRKPKQPEISMEEQIRRFNARYEAEAAGAVWPDASESVVPETPRAGW